MSSQGSLFSFDESFIADAAVAKYRVVIAGEVSDTKGKHCKNPVQDSATILGVAQHATTASGDTVLVRRAGLTKLEVATANVTYGVPLRIHDAQGRADRQTAAWVSGDGVIGYAEEASAASGDVIECWLAIRTLLA